MQLFGLRINASLSKISLFYIGDYWLQKTFLVYVDMLPIPLNESVKWALQSFNLANFFYIV